MERISILIYRHIIGALTPEEKAELDGWTARSRENEKFVKRVTSPDELQRWRERRNVINTERPAHDMRLRIDSLMADDCRHRMRRKLTSYIIGVAASLLLITGVSLFLLLDDTPSQDSSSMNISGVKQSRLDDIHYGSTKAVLTLSNGSTVAFSDTTLSYPDASDSGLHRYVSENNAVEELNLSVPKGGEFKITLEDSTEVWLNADSRLIYPSVFGTGERRVKVSGEAYFSVHHEEDRPFYVDTNDQTIRVYGTTFNVRNYPDDNLAYITLETGSIALSRPGVVHGGEVMMSPGHHATYDKDSELMSMTVVDPAVISSWRHGKFVFENQPLRCIMRDLSRWYDFDYEFADSDIEEIIFLGSIPRYSDFTIAVSIIEKCSDLRISIRDGKVYIQRK
ncbi:FecR family protein [uncultured Duncaniella sp.]|uniref:FecR family protein n=1 Tax=uncultured Duncaniella sp. TaxID=2768039 RepID=UPI0025A9F3F5|nr:FecR family protein [uncultured Duncaniella sp.]